MLFLLQFCYSCGNNSNFKVFRGGIYGEQKRKADFMKGELTNKEKLFCKYISLNLSPREAAAKSGYLFAEKSGMKLMENKSIMEYIKKLKSPKVQKSEVENGLRRVIFGSITDALKLLKIDEIKLDDLETLDLFSVSEIKFNKSGGVEIKFFDKIKALEKLWEISEKSAEGSESNFFEALIKSSKDIWEVEN